MNTLDLLRERGFVHQTSNDAALRTALDGNVTLYLGIDPTRDSLHVGHLVSVMLLAHFQRGGHRPILVLGGGTTMVGDPTGKTEMREILAETEIRRNLAGVQRQLARFLDFGSDGALMLNNADWLLELSYLAFLRDIGRHFSVNQLLQHETYRERLAGEGLNFIELNYALLQAYDFLHLFSQHGCRLQVGGSDQWFNILAGVDLIRRAAGHEAFGLVSPLVMASSGAKMGKTEAGAIWLDPERTSPYAFYQYWINVDDADVARFLKLFTFLPPEEIEQLGALEGADLRQAKERLAIEVTSLVHGAAAAEQARVDAGALFGGESGDLSGVPTTVFSRARVEAGIDIVDLLVETGLASSRGNAKAQLQAGGVYLSNQRVGRAGREVTLADLPNGQLLLRRGKKEYRRIVVE